MAYRNENVNPAKNLVGDCVVRAVALACGLSWDDALDGLTEMAHHMKDMPNANNVWGAFLKSMGFVRYSIPNTCPDCYTIRDFSEDHPNGVYVLGTGSHAVACINGTYMDSWDSGDETVLFYYKEVDL